MINNDIRGLIRNAPKSMWKRNLSCDGICIFFRNAPKSKMFIFCFQNQMRKKARDQLNFSHLILKTENEPKMNIFDFGAFRKKCICHHVQHISSTYFLGHFKLPPVLLFNEDNEVSQGFTFLTFKNLPEFFYNCSYWKSHG